MSDAGDEPQQGTVASDGDEQPEVASGGDVQAQPGPGVSDTGDDQSGVAEGDDQQEPGVAVSGDDDESQPVAGDVQPEVADSGDDQQEQGVAVGDDEPQPGVAVSSDDEPQPDIAVSGDDAPQSGAGDEQSEVAEGGDDQLEPGVVGSGGDEEPQSDVAVSGDVQPQSGTSEELQPDVAVSGDDAPQSGAGVSGGDEQPEVAESGDGQLEPGVVGSGGDEQPEVADSGDDQLEPDVVASGDDEPQPAAVVSDGDEPQSDTVMRDSDEQPEVAESGDGQLEPGVVGSGGDEESQPDVAVSRDDQPQSGTSEELQPDVAVGGDDAPQSDAGDESQLATAVSGAGDRPQPVTAVRDRDEPQPGPFDDFEDSTEPQRWTRAAAIAAGVLVVLAGVYVGTAWLLDDRVPAGATVAGVEIGGLPEVEAVERLHTTLGPVAEDELPVAAGDRRTSLDPAVFGLELDAEATVAPLVGFGLEPTRLWRHIFGMQEVTPATNVDEAAFDAGFDGLVEALRSEPVDGTVVFVDGEPRTTAAQEGLEIDPEIGRAEILEEWLTAARPLELSTRPIEPDITDEDVDRAMREIARPFADAPISVSVAGQIAQLPVATTTAAAQLVPEAGQLVLQLGGEALAEAVVDRTDDLLAEARNAHFTFTDGTPEIVPGVAGQTLDPEALAAAVAEAGTGEDRTAEVELVEVDPEQTTAALEELGVVERVAEFSTGSLGGADRVHNLTLGASKVNGVLLRPDETFSLNQALSPITREAGFRGASVVVGGVLQQGVGGGLSQLATTTYNAGFLAGLEDVEHRPHSFYFSRYPEGRESTIYGDQIDVKIGNNTPYGVLFQSWISGGRLHVTLWSTPHWEVGHSTSGRSEVVQPRTVYNTSAGCIAQGAGSPGFAVTVRRTLTLDGVVEHEESNWWRYQPQNRIVCGPPPSADDDDDDEDDDEDD